MSLDNVVGFEHFVKFFSEFRDHYVVIVSLREQVLHYYRVK